jgi:signal peptidase
LGAEISRAYLIKKSERGMKKYFIFFLIAITLLFTLLNISFNKLTGLPNQQPIKLLEFFGYTFITLFSMNLLASYLSYLGGATASISYMGTLMAFEWFSPILPDPHWTLGALVGTIAPAIGYIVIQSSLLTPQEIKKNRKRKQKSTGLGWPTVAIFCLLIIFFSYGYLGVKPTVIYSGSMQPALDVGDITLIEKIDTDELKEGDIIQYINEFNNTIIHRIVEIEISEGKKYFITKGDANNFEDSPPITKQRILGKSIFTIPKLGLLQIYVRSFFKDLNIPIS